MNAGTIVSFEFRGEKITGKVIPDTRAYVTGTLYKKSSMVEVKFPGSRTWTRIVVPNDRLKVAK